MPSIIKLIAASALVATSGAVNAEEWVDKECPYPESSTRFESCVLTKETADHEKTLHRLIQERLKISEAPNELRASQRAWEKYRDKTCAYEQSEYGGINSINAVRCVWALTKDRVRYFKELR